MRAPRLLIAATTAALLGGCTGQIEEDLPEGITPAQEAARKAWVVSAQPVLQEYCSECHGGSMPAVAWFEGGPDVNAQKEDLLTYTKPLVDFNSPMLSLLLKKGAHDGPALTASQASGILDWIQKERDARPEEGGFPVKTTPLVAMLCTSGAPGTPTCPLISVPLDEVGSAGSKIEFTASNLSGSLYLSSLKLVPGPQGAYLDHPVIVTVPAMGEPVLDPLDRYSTLKLNLAAGAPAAMQQIGTGTASFIGFNPADAIAIYAKEVGPMKPQ